tara:strand:- start:631 stop:780 length:150 start_codon:yes stop_codon:yes gene_type:complete
LEERLLWEQEVAGSNPVSPTIEKVNGYFRNINNINRSMAMEKFSVDCIG